MTKVKSTYEEQAQDALAMMSLVDAIGLVHDFVLEQIDINGSDQEELEELSRVIRAFDIDVEDLLREAK